MEYTEYYCTIDNLKETLDLYGVAVIKNVCPPDECHKLINQFWSELNELTSLMEIPLDQHDSKTWRTLYELYPLHSMLIQYFGIGHFQSIWTVRQNPTIGDIFAKIHNCSKNDLLVSFDGASIHLPPEKTGKGWFREGNWLHTDQSPKRNELSIQGMVTLNDINDKDATLMILESSHKFHEEFFLEKYEGRELPKDDWYKINDDVDWFIAKGCARKCVKAEAGSLILWNSKTMHQGIEPQKNRKKENTRIVFYVCESPKVWATELNLKKKIKAFNELRTTSHYPHQPKLFPLAPRTYGGPLPNVKKLQQPILSNYGKLLAGFTLTDFCNKNIQTSINDFISENCKTNEINNGINQISDDNIIVKPKKKSNKSNNKK
jgi:hypothetical protein